MLFSSPLTSLSEAVKSNIPNVLELEILTELDASLHILLLPSNKENQTIMENVDVDNEAFFDEYPDWQVSRILIYAGC
jgi:homoserine trans-succinylase